MVDYYNDGSILREGGFEFTSRARTGAEAAGWIWIDPVGYADTKKSGGKIHLSVAPEKMAQAWKIVVEEMIKDKASYLSARAVAPHAVNTLANPDHPHAGKMITFFTNANFNDEAAEKYRRLLDRIGKRLQARGIGPGPEVKGERKMLGSDHISFRGRLSEIFSTAAPRDAGIVEAPQAKTPQVFSQMGQLDWATAKESPSNKLDILYVMVKNEAEAEKLRSDLKASGINSQSHTFANDPVFGKGTRVHVWGKDIEAVRQKQLEEVATWGWGQGDSKLQKGNGYVQEFSLRTKVNSPAEANEKINALRALGMDGKTSYSEELGNTVLLTSGLTKLLPELAKRESGNNQPSSRSPRGPQRGPS